MIDELVTEHGEEHRLLIEAAIKFLDENEASWNLETPVDRKEYVQYVLCYATPKDA